MSKTIVHTLRIFAFVTLMICLMQAPGAQAQLAETAWQALLHARPEAMEDPTLGSLERAVLNALTPEQHAAFADGADPAGLVLASGETLADFLDREAGKGFVASGLEYFPLPRCVVLETWSSTLGKMNADEKRNFIVRGEATDLSDQGGSSTGCGVPVLAQALMVNFRVSDNGNNAGQLRVWASDQAPGYPVINYTADTGLIFNNSTALDLCLAPPCAKGDFRVWTKKAAAHVRMDILGYFAPTVDEDTTYSAGNQLSLTDTTFDVEEGPGSGLDADTLDGMDSAALATAAALTAHASDTGNPHAVTIDQVTSTTTKGDLLVENGTTVTRLPVGADGESLVADSSEPAGLRWQAAGGGGGASVQAGSVTLGSGDDFVDVLTFMDNFSPAFSMSPFVTLTAAAAGISDLFTTSVTTAGFSAQATLDTNLRVIVDDEGNVGKFNSLVVVDGHPAISYLRDGLEDLMYVRASSASGSAWNAPVVVDSSGRVGEDTSLAVVDGHPAISYVDASTDTLEYVRASDPSGNAWNLPITVDSIGAFGGNTSLAVVDGHPAISYRDSSAGVVKYVRASDASGSAWNAPITIDSGVGLTSLVVVDGHPAITYTDSGLMYVRASDASGSAWNAPVTVDNSAGAGDFISLAVVAGHPAISYLNLINDDLMYVRASDTSGSAWNPPVSVDTVGAGQHTSLAVVAGHPAISYFDGTNDDLKYVQASDASGSAWSAPVTVDSDEFVGTHSSLAVVDGKPAISYYHGTFDELRYAYPGPSVTVHWIAVEP